MTDSQAEPLIRVLIVDDSVFMRTALSRMIESDTGLRVLGTAHDGAEALRKIATLDPDVVTMDVEMPGLSGLETLRRIMHLHPRPVLMVSRFTHSGAEASLEALNIGAFDCIAKMAGEVAPDVNTMREELVTKIKAAAQSRREAIAIARMSGRSTGVGTVPGSRQIATPSGHRARAGIVAIGASTGGPKALQQMLPLLPANISTAVLVVQHMPAGFTGPFADRLNRICKLNVVEAAHDGKIEASTVYIAPAGQHMTVVRRSRSQVLIQLSTHPSGLPHMPSVDVMMCSVAEVFHEAAMGIIMTGMGADGVQGMTAIERAGGLTVGQDERTCSVYGMPRSCAEAGVLQRVVSLLDMPNQILQATQVARATAAGS